MCLSINDNRILKWYSYFGDHYGRHTFFGHILCTFSHQWRYPSLPPIVNTHPHGLPLSRPVLSESAPPVTLFCYCWSPTQIHSTTKWLRTKTIFGHCWLVVDVMVHRRWCMPCSDWVRMACDGCWWWWAATFPAMEALWFMVVYTAHLRAQRLLRDSG